MLRKAKKKTTDLQDKAVDVHRQESGWHLLFAQHSAQLKTQRAAFHPVLKIQMFCAAFLLCVCLLCRQFCPVGYAFLQAQYEVLFEGADYTNTLLRFAQQTVQTIALPASAASAPAGASMECYHSDVEMVLPVQTYIISSGYGWRDDPFTGESAFHSGIDFAAAEGETVYAVMDGFVVRNYLSDSYGNCICIRHADGSVALYAHLQYAFAQLGQVVAAGEAIGTVGQTGAATGAHLHFEVLVNNETQDPTGALGL